MTISKPHISRLCVPFPTPPHLALSTETFAQCLTLKYPQRTAHSFQFGGKFLCSKSKHYSSITDVEREKNLLIRFVILFGEVSHYFRYITFVCHTCMASLRPIPLLQHAQCMMRELAGRHKQHSIQ